MVKEMSSSINLRTLVLNSNYLPISLFPLHTIPVEDAVTRIFGGTCHSVFDFDRQILTPNLDMRWPAVIARNSNLRIKETVKLRREAVYYRDHGVCAYCEKTLTLNDLTYDHVIPRVKGGAHAWENIVSSCPSCNSKKGDSLPVGVWKPKKRPFKPNYYQLLEARRRFPITIDDESWIAFLGDWKAEIKLKTH